MGVDVRQVRDYIVRPTLELLDLPHIDSAERLIMGTGAQESAGFRYLHQLGKGPALGLWQMEPVTFRDLWERFGPRSKHKVKIGKKLAELSVIDPTVLFHSAERYQEDNRVLEDQLIWNLRFACAMCRIHYYARRFSFTGYETVQDLARIWKKHYNTVKGKGTEREFIVNWNLYLTDLYSEMES